MSFLRLWHRVIRNLEQQPNLSSNIAQLLQLDLVWELLRHAELHEDAQNAFFLLLPATVPLWSVWVPSSAKLMDARSLWVQAWLAERPQRLGELQVALMSRQFGCWLWQGVAALVHGVPDPVGAAAAAFEGPAAAGGGGAAAAAGAAAAGGGRGRGAATTEAAGIAAGGGGAAAAAAGRRPSTTAAAAGADRSSRTGAAAEGAAATAVTGDDPAVRSTETKNDTGVPWWEAEEFEPVWVPAWQELATALQRTIGERESLGAYFAQLDCLQQSLVSYIQLHYWQQHSCWGEEAVLQDKQAPVCSGGSAGSGTSTGRVVAAGAGKRVMERLREVQAMAQSVNENGNGLANEDDSSIAPSWSSAASNEVPRILHTLGVSFLLPPYASLGCRHWDLDVVVARGASSKQHLRRAGVGGVDFRTPMYGDRDAAVRAFTAESRRAFAEKVQPLWAAEESAAAAGGGTTEGVAAAAAAAGGGTKEGVAAAAAAGGGTKEGVAAAAAAAAGGGTKEGVAAAAGGGAKGYASSPMHISLTVKVLQRLHQCDVPGYGEQVTESISGWLLLLCMVLRCCSPADRVAYMKAEGGQLLLLLMQLLLAEQRRKSLAAAGASGASPGTGSNLSNRSSSSRHGCSNVRYSSSSSSSNRSRSSGPNTTSSTTTSSSSCGSGPNTTTSSSSRNSGPNTTTTSSTTTSSSSSSSRSSGPNTTTSSSSCGSSRGTCGDSSGNASQGCHWRVMEGSHSGVCWGCPMTLHYASFESMAITKVPGGIVALVVHVLTHLLFQPKGGVAMNKPVLQEHGPPAILGGTRGEGAEISYIRTGCKSELHDCAAAMDLTNSLSVAHYKGYTSHIAAILVFLMV